MNIEFEAIQQKLEQIDQKLDFLIRASGRKQHLSGQLLNVQQAADYLHISPSHLYALIYEGKLKPMQRKKHGRILFTRELLDEYLKTN